MMKARIRPPRLPATGRKRTAKYLVAVVTAYCRQHFEQVCQAAFANEMARRAGEASRGQRAGRIIPKGVAAVPPLYGFFIAVTAGQALELFDELAEHSRGMKPLGPDRVSAATAAIVADTMQIGADEAAATVRDAMDIAPDIAGAACEIKGASDDQFQANINHLDREYARAILLYCAAEKTADLLFAAWRDDPRHPPAPDGDAAAEFARLVGARILEPGEALDPAPLPAAGAHGGHPAPPAPSAPAQGARNPGTGRPAAPSGAPPAWPNLNLAG